MESQKQFWDEAYKKGNQLNRYPYDHIVSFIYKNAPKFKKREDINILELGCGAGNNLWFAAREGFNVTGIDISATAINYAKQRFIDENLNSTFLVGDFTLINQLDKKFDLVFDRLAVSYTSYDNALKLVSALKNVLVEKGLFMFNPFSEMHSMCASGHYESNGMTVGMSEGVSGTNETYFYGRRDIYNLLKDGFIIESLQHVEATEMVNAEFFKYAEWRVTARKV